MATPFQSAGGQSSKSALFRVVAPPTRLEVPVCFNPTEYQLQKANNFAEIGIPGLESPPIQFTRGGSEKLTLDLVVDTSNDMSDVRQKYVNSIRALMRLDGSLHAPPIVQFVWDSEIFLGVLESLTVTYTLFDQVGVPVRAKLGVAMKEYRPVEIQLKESPTVFQRLQQEVTAQAGDTLDSLSARFNIDPTDWRKVAQASGITDPRGGVRAGVSITIPSPSPF